MTHLMRCGVYVRCKKSLTLICIESALRASERISHFGLRVGIRTLPT